MTYWRTLAQVVRHVTRDTGKAVTEDDILEMAERGDIQVGARLPIRKTPGKKEVQWHNDDGTPVGMASVATDGVLRRLDQYSLQQLMLHDGVDLAGARWDIPGGDTLVAGQGAGYIQKSDICLSETEYLRIVALISGKNGHENRAVNGNADAEGWKGMWWAEIATLDMANNIAAKLHDQGKPHSARVIADEMVRRVNDIERRAGTDRKCVEADRIRKTVLRGWEYKSE